MVLERVKFFESTDLETLEYEINEFLSKLPQQFAEFVDIKYDHPFQRTVIYKLTKSEQELIALAESMKEEERRRMEEEARRPISEEELQRITEENNRKRMMGSSGGGNNNNNDDDHTPAPAPIPTTDTRPPPDEGTIPVPVALPPHQATVVREAVNTVRNALGQGIPGHSFGKRNDERKIEDGER